MYKYNIIIYFIFVFSRTWWIAIRVKGCPCTKPEQKLFSLSFSPSISLFHFSRALIHYIYYKYVYLYPPKRSNHAHIRSSVSNRMRWRHCCITCQSVTAGTYYTMIGYCRNLQLDHFTFSNLYFIFYLSDLWLYKIVQLSPALFY